MGHHHGRLPHTLPTGLIVSVSDQCRQQISTPVSWSNKIGYFIGYVIGCLIGYLVDFCIGLWLVILFVIWMVIWFSHSLNQLMVQRLPGRLPARHKRAEEVLSKSYRGHFPVLSPQRRPPDDGNQRHRRRSGQRSWSPHHQLLKDTRLQVPRRTSAGL